MSNCWLRWDGIREETTKLYPLNPTKDQAREMQATVSGEQNGVAAVVWATKFKKKTNQGNNKERERRTEQHSKVTNTEVIKSNKIIDLCSDDEVEILEEVQELPSEAMFKNKFQRKLRNQPSAIMTMATEEEKRVKCVLSSKGDELEIIAKIGTDTVERRSFQTLQPETWLGDEVIHFYLQLLARRDCLLSQQDQGRKQSHFFKSFFVTKLLNEGSTKKDDKGVLLDGQYSYGNVRRWGRKVAGRNIFELDKLFFPVNYEQSHWFLIVVYMEKKIIQVYDSFQGQHKKYLNYIFKYLKDEHFALKGTSLPNEEKWQLIPTSENTPFQRNGYDCGVYLCTFTNLISMDLPLIVREGQSDLCRRKIALAILTKRTYMSGGNTKNKKKKY